MESNKKSFWDSLGELLTSLSQLLILFTIILFIVGAIAHIFDFFRDIIRGDKTKLVKLGVWVFVIVVMWSYYSFKIENNQTYITPPPPENNILSGQEIWTKKMENYNPERGY
jgi:hypothetical protein